MQDPSFYKQETMHELKLPSAPSLPHHIGPYPIESLLHQSRSSLLYLGTHPETKVPVAIKVLSPTAMIHPELTSHFIKESRIIALADHPNIVKLYGEGEWDHKLYIAMEFIQGISLRQFILQRSLSLKKILDILLQTAYALLHLHTHGVIHRDLKPENILIQEDGKVKVVDFGIAQLFNEKTRAEEGTGRVIGTPNYMSPEQKENPLNITLVSDIYALGVTAYELFLGKPSYGVFDLSQVPKGIKAILEKMLEKDASKRYQDIVDFIQDVSGYFHSGKWAKDKPSKDLIKELSEEIRELGLTLIPSSPPQWPLLSMSLARRIGSLPRGLFLDFFSLPNDSYLILLGEAQNPGLSQFLRTAELRGMCHALVKNSHLSLDTPFDLLAFINTLNQLLLEQPATSLFFFEAILLDVRREELTYVPCGISRLIYLPNVEESPHFLSVDNPPLGGQEKGHFLEVIDNWKVGSLLLLHTLFPIDKERKEVEENALFQKLLEAHWGVSMNRQAESILKKSLSLLTPERRDVSHLLLEIERIDLSS